jgi:hypothetical protein
MAWTFGPEATKGPLCGADSKRMMGLEATTFCMAKAAERSRRFARVR